MVKRKAFCECRYGSAKSLWFIPDAKTGGQVWICGKCNLPKYLIWESYLDTCEDCFSDFSSPWETICQRCHRIASEGRPYRGWLWASRQALKPLSERLGMAAELRSELPVAKFTLGIPKKSVAFHR